MSWKPIDYQGIVTLDLSLIDLLNNYLKEKESLLAHSLLKIFPETGEFRVSKDKEIKLSDAIEIFGKMRHRHDERCPFSNSDWKANLAKINLALWDYVEIIEGCVVELFQQLEQTTLEQWHLRIAQVVSAIKEILLHKIEDLVWAIKRLEDLLRKYRKICGASLSFYENLSNLWKPLLDRALLKNLKKSEIFLLEQYQKFIVRYDGYVLLLGKVEKSLGQLHNFKILATLDRESQSLFIKLYQLLKLWELNKSEKTLPTKDLVIALRNEANTEKVTTLFREYYFHLRKHLFAISLELKKSPSALLENVERQAQLQGSLSKSIEEADFLGNSISQYREFLLVSDPDPYVSTRLGFSEWTAGPEPEQLKPILNLRYDVQGLKELYEHLLQIATKLTEAPRVDVQQVEDEIMSLLHEMSQPLATHKIIRSYAEKILEKMQQLDELGSLDFHVIEFTGNVFGKILRADWKYNVLHGISLFHKLYRIHLGLVKAIEDRQHSIRLAKFQKLLSRFQEWVKTQKMHLHYHEMELDGNDIKGYLQDFLGYVQRVISDKELNQEDVRCEIALELLEYRYLFGNFFYQLRQNESEGPLIRRQFLFVDQYFESVETLLQHP